jgi:hypothetical protein
MDLITIILIVGSLANGVLLTLCMRYARSADEQATQAKDLAYAAGLSAESVHGKLDLAIAALPKKRKPRAKAEVPGEASHQELTEGMLPKDEQ